MLNLDLWTTPENKRRGSAGKLTGERDRETERQREREILTVLTGGLVRQSEYLGQTGGEERREDQQRGEHPGDGLN